MAYGDPPRPTANLQRICFSARRIRRLTTLSGPSRRSRDWLEAGQDSQARPKQPPPAGQGAGVVNHIASFWRFRFPKNRPLEVNAGELLDILQDFESGLGGDIPAIAA